MKWLHNRGNRLDLSVLGMLCKFCDCGFVVGMLTKMGKGWIDLCDRVVVVGCFLGKIIGGISPRICGMLVCRVSARIWARGNVGREGLCKY